MGAGDLQAEPGQRRGDIVEEPRAVAAVDLDHRVVGAGLVVHQHARRHLEDAGAAGQAAAAHDLQFPGRVQPSRQRVLDALPKPFQAFRIVERAAAGVLDGEGVQCHAVGEGEDLGIDDGGGAKGHGPGDAGEETRVVGGVNDDFRDRAGRIDVGFDMQLQSAAFRLAHQVGVADVGIGVEAQPVIRVAPPDVFLDFRRVPAGKPVAQGRLGVFHAGGAALGGDVAGHLFLGAPVEFPQQRRLPAVPDAGPDGADVGHGQDQQQPQPFRGLDRGDEVADRFQVVDIALERRRAHQQMVAHQPRDRFRFPVIEAQPRAKLFGDAGADLGMVAAPALGDVVKQQRQIEYPARLHLGDRRGGHRVVVRQFALFDAVQDADGADGVLVHRIDMVHVVLHLGDDAPEIGNETPEDAGLVQALERRFGILVRGQDLHEQAVGFGIGPQPPVDQFQALGDQAQRVGMDIEPVALGLVEQAQQLDGVLDERVVGLDRQAVAVDAEPFDAAPAKRQRGEAEPLPALLVTLLQDRAQDAGQVADVLGDQEVVLHHPLDPAGAGVVGIAHALADGGLDVEGEALLGAPGQVMEVAAHRPQEILGLGETPGVAGGEHAKVHQVLHVVHAVEILGDPEQGLQVAQAPLALLDVGLQHIAGVAHALVPGVALGQLGVDEVGAAAGDDVLGVTGLERVELVLVAPHPPGLEQAGADGQVAARQADAVVHGAGGVSHRQPQVPEHIEHVLAHLLGVGGALVGHQEHQVDVRMGRQLAAAVAAGGDHRELLAGHRVGRRIDVLEGEIVDRAHQLVDEVGVGVQDLRARCALLFEAAANLGPALAQGVLENLQDLGLRRVAGPPDQVVEPGDQGLAVDDVAPFADVGHGCFENFLCTYYTVGVGPVPLLSRGPPRPCGPGGRNGWRPAFC